MADQELIDGVAFEDMVIRPYNRSERCEKCSGNIAKVSYQAGFCTYLGGKLVRYHYDPRLFADGEKAEWLVCLCECGHRWEQHCVGHKYPENTGPHEHKWISQTSSYGAEGPEAGRVTFLAERFACECGAWKIVKMGPIKAVGEKP